MEKFEEFKSFKLLKLLEMLEEEDPSCELYHRKRAIEIVAARKLGVETKEIGWLTKTKRERGETKKKKKEKKKEKEKSVRKQEKDEKKLNDLRLHNQVVVELWVLNDSMEKIMDRVGGIEKEIAYLKMKEESSTEWGKECN